MSLPAVINIEGKHNLHHKNMYDHMMNTCCDMQMRHNDAKRRIRTWGSLAPGESEDE